MNFAELEQAAPSADPFVGFREEGGESFFAWGPGTDGSLSLTYRKFHFPREKSSPIWTDFAPTEHLNFSQFLSGAQVPEPRAVGAMSFSSPPEEDRASWNRLCSKIQGEIDAGSLVKAVPARVRTYALSEAEERDLRSSLMARLFGSPHAGGHRFVLGRGQSYFFGSSPELLFRRRGGELFVPAIAGTRPRGKSPEQDEALRRELLASEKELAEHRIVVEGITQNLADLGLEPLAPPRPELLPSARLYHLFTPIRARDNPQLRGEEILSALHPTPALGGFPRKAAGDLLFAEEAWDRGLYAGPLLFRRPGAEICVVAIRSALLRPGHLHVFAGAGYVQGACAEGEWAETDLKMQSVLSLLLEGSS
jgi:isochorismate synthase